MKTFNYIIQDELGIHARPAGLLTKLAKKYESSVKIRKGEKTVQASQLFMLMGLAAKRNDEIQVIIEGADEEAAFEELKDFFEKNL